MLVLWHVETGSDEGVVEVVGPRVLAEPGPRREDVPAAVEGPVGGPGPGDGALVGGLVGGRALRGERVAERRPRLVEGRADGVDVVLEVVGLGVDRLVAGGAHQLRAQVVLTGNGLKFSPLVYLKLRTVHGPSDVIVLIRFQILCMTKYYGLTVYPSAIPRENTSSRAY